ncbi:MAG: hypothetical protein LCH95_14455 [Proteobacteria bacterium]|nr:hypothetical protein [Pseudomonadota bacterium]
MEMGRRAVLASLGIGVVGGVAACGPTAPEYRDPLADLTSAQGAAVPENVPVRAGATVGLTTSNNVEQFLKYSQDGVKFAASMGASQALLKDGDPQYVVNTSIAIVRERYPQLQPVPDLATAQARHFDTTFVLDLRTKAGTMPGTRTTCDIILIAFDAQMRPISRIASHGYWTIPGYQTPDPKAAYNMALADFRSKAAQLLS